MARRRLVREKYSWKRSLAIVVVGLALAFVVGWALIQPLRPVLADRYVARGDALLASQEFGAAADEYRAALRYEPSDARATSQLDLVAKGRTDPMILRDFYITHNVQSEVSKLDRATRAFASPKEALGAGVTLYLSHDYGYARYALERATDMDPQYAEAWNYLALDDKELAKLDSSYSQKQAQAEAKRDGLTTRYLRQ